MSGRLVPTGQSDLGHLKSGWREKRAHSSFSTQSSPFTWLSPSAPALHPSNVAINTHQQLAHSLWARYCPRDSLYCDMSGQGCVLSIHSRDGRALCKVAIWLWVGIFINCCCFNFTSQQGQALQCFRHPFFSKVNHFQGYYLSSKGTPDRALPLLWKKEFHLR